jgi:NDP-sugar pyrophosphorylase family protein
MAHRLSGAIIAAGTGSRLRAASGGVPKPLVRLGDETLLQRQLRLLEAVGAAPLNVIVNSETAQLIEAGKLNLPPQLAMIIRDTPNSMESLLALGEQIRPGWFLLMTVDAVIGLGELRRFLAAALAQSVERGNASPDGVLGVIAWRGDKHPLFAEVADDGSLTRLGGESGNLVTAGVYLFSTRIFAFAAEARGRGLDAMRLYLALLLERGIKLAAVPLTNVIDVDEGEDLRTAQALISRG